MRRARHVRGECCGLSDDPEDLPIHVRKRGLVTLRKELLPYMCTEFRIHCADHPHEND